MEAQFAGAGAEQVAFGADDVADIEEFEELVIALGDRVFTDVKLEPGAVLHDVHEARFTHAADGLDAPGNTDTDFRNQLLSGAGGVFTQNAGDGGGEIEALTEGLVTEGLDIAYAGGALFKQFVF